MRRILVLFLIVGTLFASPGCTMIMWKRVCRGQSPAAELQRPSEPVGPPDPREPVAEWEARVRAQRAREQAPDPVPGAVRVARYVVAAGLTPFTLALDALLVPFWLMALPNM